jgi:hypothetical protein
MNLWNYLFGTYRGSRHVRRISAWLGFLVFGIEKIKVHRTRQVFFEAKGRRYKIKYSHAVKPRGGIEIVEISSARVRLR